MNSNLIEYIFGIADNDLILGQRLGELCGHGVNIETDIALTNISLDLFGQVRSYYQYVAELQGGNANEDTVAFLRKEHEYRNVLLCEQPNTDFAFVVARHFFFDVYHFMLMDRLQQSSDATLAAIAAKAIKEVSYHQRFSSDWVRRLGDGTEESHQRMQNALNELWVYTDELFQPTEADKAMVAAGVGVDVLSFREAYLNRIAKVLDEATLTMPESQYFQYGGRSGRHTEHMGYILTEMQYMQRTYPDMTW
jgi:ring-1,2-phenylacetyl-CoA epoxidase subunit PaaC